MIGVVIRSRVEGTTQAIFPIDNGSNVFFMTGTRQEGDTNNDSCLSLSFCSFDFFPRLTLCIHVFCMPLFR